MCARLPNANALQKSFHSFQIPNLPTLSLTPSISCWPKIQADACLQGQVADNAIKTYLKYKR